MPFLVGSCVFKKNLNISKLLEKSDECTIRFDFYVNGNTQQKYNGIQFSRKVGSTQNHLEMSYIETQTTPSATRDNLTEVYTVVENKNGTLGKATWFPLSGLNSKETRSVEIYPSEDDKGNVGASVTEVEYFWFINNFVPAEEYVIDKLQKLTDDINNALRTNKYTTLSAAVKALIKAYDDAKQY